MEVLQPFQNLLRELADHLLTELIVLVDHALEGAPTNVFQEDVDVLLVDVGAVVANDVGVDEGTQQLDFSTQIFHPSLLLRMDQPYNGDLLNRDRNAQRLFDRLINISERAFPDQPNLLPLHTLNFFLDLDDIVIISDIHCLELHVDELFLHALEVLLLPLFIFFLATLHHFLIRVVAGLKPIGGVILMLSEAVIALAFVYCFVHVLRLTVFVRVFLYVEDGVIEICDRLGDVEVHACDVGGGDELFDVHFGLDLLFILPSKYGAIAHYYS